MIVMGYTPGGSGILGGTVVGERCMTLIPRFHNFRFWAKFQTYALSSVIDMLHSVFRVKHIDLCYYNIRVTLQHYLI